MPELVRFPDYGDGSVTATIAKDELNVKKNFELLSSDAQSYSRDLTGRKISLTAAPRLANFGVANALVQ